ncbi:hypothetical protein BVF91_10185 [Thermoanaerobacterium sp. PSU-2]|jgi:transcriptional regulator of acetoin/glycerol metabolism|uniref:hypothetical protein n=1 Tax=Thermoanaerobacterium sp. PSU-2 TaxID=1930849 RepID=UPI000A166EA2|nr:hypothetical protein [Thermoanaerobacterium sp. PSU-2]ORX22647.1 hypothetical protein BVF91_10185 [Thermoanaerobacterium sp. PSU-2]
MNKIIRFTTDSCVFLESYKRCNNLNVNKNLNSLSYYNIVYEEDLKKKINLLINAFKRSLENLYVFQENNHYIYILCDANGIVLDISCPRNLLKYCHEINLKPGCSLNEKDCGTNAVSLALTEKCEVYINGKEHYCFLFHNLHCIALPIYDENNNIIGICDISSITEKEYTYAPSFIYLLVKYIRDEYLKLIYEEYLTTLNPVEINILSSVSRGKSEFEIANSLKISVPYVKKIKNSIKNKLHCKDIEECIFIAGKLDLLGYFHMYHKLI